MKLVAKSHHEETRQAYKETNLEFSYSEEDASKAVFLTGMQWGGGGIYLNFQSTDSLFPSSDRCTINMIPGSYDQFLFHKFLAFYCESFTAAIYLL